MDELQDEEIEKARENIVSVVESYGIALEKRGAEYRALCPFHNEKSPSFTVVPGKNIYHCFGCGAGGDAIDFVREITGMNFPGAVNAINGKIGKGEIIAREKTNSVAAKPEWEPLPIVPNDAPPPMQKKKICIDEKWTELSPSGSWEYRNSEGELIGYIFRFDRPDGGKEVIPQTWCMNSETGELAWRWLSFSKPRPLFGLELIKKNPKAQILIVEGEKTVIAARKLFINAGISESKLIVISWPGGGKAVKHVDWSHIKGRKICLWPDADQKNDTDGSYLPFLNQVGTKTMLEIHNKIGEDVKFIFPPDDVPCGWDLADELPEGFNVIAHLKTAIPISDIFNVPELNPVILNNQDKPAIKENEHDKNESPELRSNPYFRILGYDHEFYYIFQYEKCQIIIYTKADFSESGLIALAPIEWWEMHFSGAKGGINKSMAMNWMMRKANSRGIYDMSRIRGRGAWNDAGRLVFHHGDHLTVDSVRCEITEFDSHYVYEMRHKFQDVPAIALTDDEGAQILNLAASFRWSRPGSAILLTGWVALAPICGAIKWRPHLWLAGGAGSGKTTVLNDFVHQLLNDMDLYAQGNSSEAGIRQELKGDAMPVLFDESESNTERDSTRIQSVLSLIRQASTESQAKTLKGTSGGAAMSFHIRSMFCLASIQVGIKQQADMERMTILNLLPKKDEANTQEAWKEMQEELYLIKKDESMAGRLVRRSLELLPVTLENIKVFSTAAAKLFGSQREGDQYGTLAAGAWSVISKHRVTEDEAMGFLKAYDWDEYRENTEVNDSERALMALMGAMIKIAGYAEVTVNELIRKACGLDVDGLSMSHTNAESVLKRHGMKLDGNETLIIGNNHPQLKILMSGTPYETDLRAVLLRGKGAMRLEKTVRFSGILCRAITIPIADLLDDDVSQNGTTEF